MVGSYRETDGGRARNPPPSLPKPSTQRRLHLATELWRVDRRVTIQLGLDRLVQLSQPHRLHQPPLDHVAHILEVQVEAPLDLGERLGVEVEVVDADIALLKDERAALAPARQLRDEIGRRSQLDVDFKPLLQCRKLAEQLVDVWLEPQVYIHRRASPTL